MYSAYFSVNARSNVYDHCIPIYTNPAMAKDLEGGAPYSQHLPVISPVFLTEKSILGVPENGGWAAAKQGRHLRIGNVLGGLFAFDKTFDCDPNTVSISISPDSKYIACLIEDDGFSIDVLHLALSKVHRISRIWKCTIGIRKLQWSPDSESLFYFSNYGMFLGLFSVKTLTSRTIMAPKLDDFDRPISCFSPDGGYFAMARSDRIFVYGTKIHEGDWPLIREHKCDVNSCGVIYAGPMTLVVWNSTGSLRAITPEGKSSLIERIEHGSNVKSVDVSSKSRLMAVLIQDSKIFIYDILSWKKLLVLQHKYIIRKQDCGHIFQEADPFTEDEKMPFYKNYFVDFEDTVRFKEVKNISDSFKIKSGKKYLISFSPSGKLMASYDPLVPRAVWIWSILENQPLKCLIVLNDSVCEIQEMKWHKRLDRLALIFKGRIIFWTEEHRVFGIYSQNKMKFSWYNTKPTIGAVISPDCGVFVFIPR